MIKSGSGEPQPRLSLDDGDHDTIHTAHTSEPLEVGGISSDTSKQAEYRAKVDALADLIPEDTLVGGKRFSQLTLYEKKSVLVNRELDVMGMGRYQWFIFFLCGFGYFLDLCWAQAFGLVASSIQQELGVDPHHIGDLSTAFNTGLTVGAFTWGLLVDVLGRRWCFNLTCLIASIFGFLFAAPSNYGAICFFAAMIGFGVGGNIPIDATITLEFLPKNRRFLVAVLSTFQPIGVVVSSVISFGLIPSHSCAVDLPACNTGQRPCCTESSNRGWRYTMIVLGCITLFIFILRFIVFKFRESPKYLLSKGHDAHAIDVLYSVAKFNKMEMPSLNLEDFQALDFEESQRTSTTSTAPIAGGHQPQRHTSMFKRVFVGGFARTFGHLRRMFTDKVYVYLFVVLAIAYMADFWSFSIAGFFLPLLLKSKGADANQSVADTYRSYVWIYLPGVTAPIIASFFMEIPRLGRKWAMVFGSAMMGLSLALYQIVNSFESSIGFNAMEYWFQSFYNALLYAFTPEAFPATFRGSASGALSTLGRIASIVAPIAGQSVYNGSASPALLWLAAGGAWLSTIMIILLPYETKGKQAY